MSDEERDDAAARTGPVRDGRHGATIGNYVLLERLGRGGMASVYLAEHRGFRERVAIKLLNARYGEQEDMRRRFLREALTMREISAENRHVVKAIDVGETPAGEPYLVMEYLAGRDLQKLLKMEGPLTWPRTAALALQLCDALASTHAKNIVHRDIKPSNCVIVGPPEDEAVKLIDFGIVKDLEASGEQTGEGILLGTPVYLAPEILAHGAQPDARSDIYALGATLYALVAGRPPYEGPTATVIAYKQMHEPLVAPSERRPAALPPVPEAADELILRALERNPGRRFQTVEELAEAIRLTTDPATITAARAASGSTSAPPVILRGSQLAARGAWLSVVAAGLVWMVTREAPPVATATAAAPPAAPEPGAPLRLPPPRDDTPPAPGPSVDLDTPEPAAVADAPVEAVGDPPTDAPAPTAPPTSATSPTEPATGAKVPTEPPTGAKVPTEPPTGAKVPTEPATGAKVPTEPPTGAKVPTEPATDPPATAEPPTPAPPTSAPADAPKPTKAEQLAQRVERILRGKLPELRSECAQLGSDGQLRFTLTLMPNGVVEAVNAQPGPLRECVRGVLRDVAFPAGGGQFTFRFRGAP
jgi:serine/threonine-protein kinase